MEIKQTIATITCIEPVYPTADSVDSVWVECEAVWDEEREVFVNDDADPEWVLDEHAHADSAYVVHGVEYSSLDDAFEAALADQYEDSKARILFWWDI